MKVLPKDQAPSEEILGSHYMLFIKHYRAWQKCEGSDAYMVKAFTSEERKLISEINEKLLYSGYRIDEILSSGEMKWFVMTRAIVPEIKTDDRKISIDQMVDEVGEEMPAGESG